MKFITLLFCHKADLLWFFQGTDASVYASNLNILKCLLKQRFILYLLISFYIFALFCILNCLQCSKFYKLKKDEP